MRTGTWAHVVYEQTDVDAKPRELARFRHPWTTGGEASPEEVDASVGTQEQAIAFVEQRALERGWLFECEQDGPEAFVDEAHRDEGDPVCWVEWEEA
jgi:hypothetical protein